MGRRTVLVAGASGVVGQAALRHFASLDDWDVVGVSRRPPRVDGVAHLPIDLADEAQCRAAVRDLEHVTHVVYAALFEKPGLVPGWYEQDQMERNLVMLRNLLDPLDEVASLQHVSLLQGTKANGAHVGRMEIPGKEDRPRHDHANFYWLQEDYLRAKRDGRPWAWTILRPQVVFGDALGSNMNAIPALGVYAALLRADGRPLDYPGGAAFVTEAVDADLLARALHWAATSDGCRDEIFNITNGDVFSMRGVWPVLADAFGMDVGEDVPMVLSVELPPREPEWARLVERFGLAGPVGFEELVGQSFIYADLLLGPGATEPAPPTLVSTIKARHAGFADCVDTEAMFRRLVTRLQDQRILPPRHW